MKFFVGSSVSQISFIFLNFFFIGFAKEKSSDSNATKVVQRKWLTQLFLEAEMNFDIDPAVSPQCFLDYNFYKEHLQAQSGWAIRMLESSGWPTVGLLAGTTTHLGNWDECLLVSTHHLQGKYCLVEGSYNFDNLLKNNSNHQIVEWPSDELTVWKILNIFEKNPVRIDRKTIRWALCVPSSCSISDLEISLKKIIYPLFRDQDMDFQLHINQSSCHLKDKTNYPDEYHYAVMFFLFVIIIICSSTMYDIFRKPNEGCENTEAKELFMSFSLAQNIRQLFQYSEKNDYGIVYAMKVISMIMVIFGHRKIYSLGYPSFNPETAERNFKNSINYFELCHWPVVDIFFMLTGFLIFHLNFSSMSKNGFRYWVVSIICRWIRLIPTACALLIFFVCIVPYINDGPLWDAKISYEINHCKGAWWTTLLAVNNIFLTENQCLFVTWYIAADMQLAIVGFGLLYITTKSRSRGWIAIITTFALGAIATFTAVYVYKFHGVLPTYISFLQDTYASAEYVNFYASFYPRIGPYVVGVVAALLTKVLNEKKFKFSTQQKIIGLVVAFIIGEWYLHLGFVLEYEFDREYNVVDHAFYAATHRSVYVTATALALCIYFTTGFSSLSVIYENWVFAFLGRLSYSVFLVHTVLQIYNSASQKSVLLSSNLVNQFWWVFGDIIASYIVGILLHLLFEAPLTNVSKIVKKRLLKDCKAPECVVQQVTQQQIHCHSRHNSSDESNLSEKKKS